MNFVPSGSTPGMSPLAYSINMVQYLLFVQKIYKKNDLNKTPLTQYFHHSVPTTLTVAIELICCSLC